MAGQFDHGRQQQSHSQTLKQGEEEKTYGEKFTVCAMASPEQCLQGSTGASWLQYAVAIKKDQVIQRMNADSHSRVENMRLRRTK